MNKGTQTNYSFDHSLTKEEVQLIEQEEAILAEVLDALQKEQEKQFSDVGVNREAFLKLLQESGRSSETDLPSLLQELQIKRSLENRQRPAPLPSVEIPYFARLELKERDRVRTLLLGYSTFLSNHCNYPIIDWRNAPSAKLFYQFRQGDEFEQELPERVAEGIISARNILTISNGNLEQIQTPHCVLIKNQNNIWNKKDLVNKFFKGGEKTAIRGLSFGVGLTGARSPEVSALLDETQFALLSEDESKPLLILGGAGSGKTTIALHRLASLAFKNPSKFNENTMMVIVPDEGLARLSRNLLKIIGMKNISVSTFDQWVHKEGRKIIKGLPLRLCAETPAKVITMKRHPVMNIAIDSYLKVSAGELIDRLIELFPTATQTLRQIKESIPTFNQEQPMHNWLSEVKEQVVKTLKDSGKDKTKGIEEAFKNEQAKLFNIAKDRQILFSDHLILRNASSSHPDIKESHIEEVISHNREQASSLAGERFRDIDHDRKIGLDGKDISKEIHEIAGTIDVEDYPVLFEILLRKAGKIETPHGILAQYAHVVLDEAQELAPLELKVLGMALAKPASVSIAGDAAQQTDVTTSFDSWEHVLTLLGIKGVKSTHLTTNYRSPAPISTFAHQVLGPEAGPEPKTTKDGAPVLRANYHTYGETIIVLHDLLSGLIDAEPHASIAIITKDETSSQQIYQDLSAIPEVRLVENGNFTFTPGIDVTHVGDVKGLEFDYVVIPDADAHVYKDDAKSRRALHVACTRAVHQLLVISSSNPSPILPVC
ncbi:MAG: AAA family ATPase [Bdellovibrionota bacterium]